MDYGMDYQGGGGGGGGFGGGRPSSSGYSQQSGGGGGGGGNRRPYDEQTMTPVTIAMANASHPDGSADGSGSMQLADGRKVYHVRIVAATRESEVHSTNVVYTVEDGTGLLEVKQWIEDDGCSAMEEVRQKITQENGLYLKITGQIKDYDGKKMLVADSVRPLNTGNELTHHMLEVVYAEQAYQRRQQGFASAPGMGMGGGGIGFGGMATPKQHHQAKMQQQTSNNNGAGGGSNQELTDAVKNYIRDYDNGDGNGVSVTQCVQALAGRFAEDKVRGMVDQLSGEGDIYSTIDEDHFSFAM